MKLGIIGLSGAGKSTIFDALTKTASQSACKEESRIGTIRVPDTRVDALARMFTPEKTTYAQVEYLLPGIPLHRREPAWNTVRDCDALIHVIRCFSGYVSAPPSPLQDFHKIEQDLILTDLATAEKRLERLALDQKRGVQIDHEEYALLTECRGLLESEIPLREQPDIAGAPALKGFAFLSAKPMLVLLNNDDDNESLPEKSALPSHAECMVVRGRLEQELSRMPEQDTREFLELYGIRESAMDRVVRHSYDLLGLISFFTVGSDEVRAWTIRRGTEALDAAAAVHSDMKKGFIRAEVVAYQDLADAGSYKEARKRGTVRLEGKTYVVKDGDIIHFRFNV